MSSTTATALLPFAAEAAPPVAAASSAAARHGRGGRVLFVVAFESVMTDAHLARLARELNLSTHMSPKRRPDPTSPGVAQLDHFSGLFLERGPYEGEWVFEARTWDHPAPESVHQWRLLAAQAAHHLDPTVTMPERLPARGHEVDRPVGEASNCRFALGAPLRSLEVPGKLRRRLGHACETPSDGDGRLSAHPSRRIRSSWPRSAKGQEPLAG